MPGRACKESITRLEKYTRRATRLSRIAPFFGHPLRRWSRLALLLIVWQLVGGLALAVATEGPTLALAAPLEQATPPNLAAPSAIAIDTASGRIIYSKNPHRRQAMASTTKIMTALTALSVEGTNPAETYQVVREDLVGEASMGLRLGETVTFQDLLYGMLLNSGNDAATAIARYAGNKLPGPADPVTRFVARMNTYALEMGLRNSHYANPHGLDQAEHYSSAFDLAITGWYALRQPLLSKIVATASTTVAGKRLNSLNWMLGKYAGANGVKPGYTDDAGLCLVFSATRNGQTALGVVLGEANSGYYADPPALLDYSFSQIAQPDFQKTVQQGATEATAADYLGRVIGNKLVPFGAPEIPGGAGASIIGLPGSNGVIDAQISQTTPGQTTPTDSGGNSAGSGGDSGSKKEGGFNLFGLILILLLAAGVLYVLLRFTPVGGERGREIAYSMEDYANRGWQAVRGGLTRLWRFVRPGSEEGETGGQDRMAASRQTSPRPTLPANSNNPELDRRRNQVFNDASTRRETNSPSSYGASPPAPVAPAPPSRPYPPAPARYEDTDQKSNPASYSTPTPPAPLRPSPTPARPNPLENIFDDVDPFAEPEAFKAEPLRNSNPAPEPAARPVPPRPLSNRPQPTQPSPTPPPISTGPTPSGAGTFEPTRNPPPASPRAASLSGSARAGEGGDSLAMRARQAIDYAYAGRITASTEEFRRVVEQNPLFDFGGIEEFDQMPVLGFKALSTAYRDSNRPKFAVLLLDLAIEKYPNDLELRNMQRTFRREAGQS